MVDKKKFTYGVLKDLRCKQKSPSLSIPRGNKRVITEKDIKEIKSGEEFVISKGDIITPLAKDKLKEKKVKLIIE